MKSVGKFFNFTSDKNMKAFFNDTFCDLKVAAK